MRRICKKAEGGGYLIKGTHYDNCRGSRAEVGHGTAYRTSGGLTKTELKQNKHGRWVSKALSKLAKTGKRLEKAGYFTRKGHFGYVRKDAASSRKRRRTHRKKRKSVRRRR